MARWSRALPVAGFASAFVGLVLLVVQVVRTINGSALGTIGAVLLWLGVGLLAVAIVFLTATLLAPAVESTPLEGESAATQP